jgi:hypothetical protein
MPPESQAHGNEPPAKQEALQYITYSAKELLYLLNEKVDGLDQKIDLMALEQAKLDARYVSIPQFKAYQSEAVVTRRFAVASVIASIGAFSTFIGLLISGFGG